MLANKNLSTFIIITILAIGSLSAYSVSDGYFGNRLNSFDARIFAMGNASAFNDQGAFGILINPANLTLMKNNFGLQGGMGINRNEDTRMLPLYNSFDNYIDDSVYSSNINAFDDYAGIGYATMKYNMLRLGIAGYYNPLISYDGIYDEQIRNNRNTDSDVYPEMIARNKIENEGTLFQTGGALSLGLDLSENMILLLGADISILKGDIDEMVSIRWSDWAKNTLAAVNPNFRLPDSTFVRNTSLEGEKLKYGAALQLGSRIGLGFAYTPKVTLDRTGSYLAEKYDSADTLLYISDSGEISEDYILPSEFRFGISYRPQNVMRTWFNLDLEYVQWKDVEDYYEDTINFYAGVEHHILHRIPLRMGFQAVNSWSLTMERDVEEVDGNEVITDVYIAKKVLTPMITGGSSIALGKHWSLDLGFGYSWREYEALDLFRDTYYNDKLYTSQSTYLLWPNQYIKFKDRGWDNPDKVKENFISLNTSLSFTW
ncbi:MAG: hypothetical protein PHI68_06135 [Candidatus Cloacimonetes bacterium]|nr:hypothetical protein [Candidatus Cloacimonadota bacterium]